MSQNHNVLLVTNDHVQTMKEIAKNSIVVSAIDRSFVSVNDMDKVNREVALNAVSNGNDYVHENSKDDQSFPTRRGERTGSRSLRLKAERTRRGSLLSLQRGTSTFKYFWSDHFS